MTVEGPNGNASTSVVHQTEPIQLEPVHTKPEALSISSKRAPSVGGRSLGSTPSQRPPASQIDNDASPDRNESLPSPTTASPQVELWNYPRINIYRVAACFWAFVIMGMNDATYGAIIPYLQTYYDLSYTIVALVFLSPFVGYNVAALLNNVIHMKMGQRGVAFFGPLCHIIAYAIIAAHPPYPVLVIAFMLAGLGNGFEDAGWNAWLGVMPNANEMLGFLHGWYGAGATVAPLIATTMITQAGLQWYTWYYCMVSFAVLELLTSVHAFWAATGAAFREANTRTTDAGGSRLKEAILQKPAARVSWLVALFLLGYVGVEVALGGWIVEFMIQVRDGGAFQSGMSATGFWLGITVGRVVLGFVTPRIGEKVSLCIYLPLSMGLELLFWLQPSFIVSSIAVGLLGFFMGPLFPIIIALTTKLIPKHLHVSTIGFAAAFGGSGGALFPYVVGLVAQAKGVRVLQPIALALLGVILVLALGLPRVGKKSA